VKVRLAEVAAAAGVSVPTVSKVVHGRSDVAADTRSRVEEVLAAYKYAAPRRAPEGPGLIDLVFTGPLNPWAVEIINGAEKAAAAAGHRLTISILDGKAASDDWLARVSASRTNGIILGLAELPSAYRARLNALNVPMVIVDPVGQPDPHIPSVGAANWAGGYTATEFLVKLGHRSIATITGRPSLPCSQARVNGYLAALEHAGLTADPAHVRTGDFTFEAALTAATAMLARADRPTAIFAGNDFEAMGVYEAARRHRLRIPEDLSVVGFDDLPMSAWVAPPLTTVAQPLAQMAATATQMVLQSAPDPASNRVELATSLVVRSSTAPPRQGPR
jgi:DNA-binding LacI/PurR family transcriptional regulator